MGYGLSRGMIGLAVFAALAVGCGGDHQGVSGAPLDASSDTRARDTSVDVREPVCTPLAHDPLPSWVSWPTSGEIYQPETLFYVSALDFPEPSSSGTTCCTDYGPNSPGEGYDNTFAALVDSLNGVGLDFQTYFTEQLEAGALVLLWDLRASGGDAVMASLRGRFAEGTDFTLATMGAGQFQLEAESFLDGTGTPVGVVGPASLESGILSAGRGELYIRMPLYGVDIDMLLENTVITGEETLDDAGNLVLYGELSATLALEGLFEAFNDFILSEQCQCLGIREPLYIFDTSTQSWRSRGCLSDADVRCDLPSNADCALLAGNNLSLESPQICDLAGSLFNSIADIDTDCDERADAISMGFHITAYPASLAP